MPGWPATPSLLHPRYLRRGDPSAGYPLFENESLCWPGFVEFDDVNGKVLTYSAEDRSYKVWDLKAYTPLYTIVNDDINEIKIRCARVPRPAERCPACREPVLRSPPVAVLRPRPPPMQFFGACRAHLHVPLTERRAFRSPGIMLIIFHRKPASAQSIQLIIRSIETGEVHIRHDGARDVMTPGTLLAAPRS